MREPILVVRDLAVQIDTKHRGTVRAVDGVNLEVRQGEILGLVGESGSGKSVTCLAVMGMLPQPGGRIASGEILFEGQDLLRLSDNEIRKIRGAKIAVVLQDPMTSLNPCFTIGDQIGEALTLHQGLRGAARRTETIEALKRVRVPAADQRLGSYPHELSGGMRQRVSGAIALACSPRLLIADEPTTSLDATVELQYLSLLVRLRDELDLSILIVTHDLKIITRICDRVAVMYAGRIVESGPVERIARSPAHPYTKALFDSMPRVDSEGRINAIGGRPPDPGNFPPGCRFAARCPRAQARCLETDPLLESVGEFHAAACLFPLTRNDA